MNGRRRGVSQDAGVIGWISTSEVFLLCGAMMLVVALALSSKLEQTSQELGVARRHERLTPEIKARLERLDRENQELSRKNQDLSLAIKHREDEARALAARSGELERALASARRERDRLSEEVEALAKGRDGLEKQVGALAKERDRLANDLALATGERDRLAAELDARLKELAGLRIENARLAANEPVLKGQIAELKGRLASIDESIVLPLKSARLIVKVQCDELPAGLDLDLYVQDPHDQVCSWVQPRTLWQNHETGLLILSEDLRNVRKSVEEIYYSLSVEPSDVGHPYLVFGMVRAKSGKAPPAEVEIPVRWEVSVAWRDRLEAIGGGVRRVKTVGQVVFLNGGYAYPGLVPLAGFWKASDPGEPPRLLADDGLPKAFRGWSDGSFAAGAPPVVKLRDN